MKTNFYKNSFFEKGKQFFDLLLLDSIIFIMSSFASQFIFPAQTPPKLFRLCLPDKISKSTFIPINATTL